MFIQRFTPASRTSERKGIGLRITDCCGYCLHIKSDSPRSSSLPTDSTPHRATQVCYIAHNSKFGASNHPGFRWSDCIASVARSERSSFQRPLLHHDKEDGHEDQDVNG